MLTLRNIESCSEDSSRPRISLHRPIMSPNLSYFFVSDPNLYDREVKKSYNSKTCRNGISALKRKRRNRGHFTQHQLQYLERLFSRQKYLTRDERTVLARSLDMTELQIRNWFQNRRYLKRRETNKNTKQDKPDSSTCARVKN